MLLKVKSNEADGLEIECNVSITSLAIPKLGREPSLRQGPKLKVIIKIASDSGIRVESLGESCVENPPRLCMEAYSRVPPPSS